MLKRVIDISSQSYIHKRNQQLIIEQDGETVGSVPIEDLGFLILQNPAITISLSLITACQDNNIVIVFCDEKHLPSSTLLPLFKGHSLHSKILSQQISMKLPAKKRLWKEIVSLKISQQNKTLERLGKKSERLKKMAQEVRSGDPENIEAQAAKLYWKILSGGKFRRDVNGSGVNALLNYGYSICRALFARAIVAGGLHPTLGLHHHNQYNGLCLADDLMEPCRPWVDFCVVNLLKEGFTEVNLTTKNRLLGLLSVDVSYDKKTTPLMVACQYLIARLKKIYAGGDIKLIYPVYRFKWM
jgi:CRISPR-associated protein Cas1